MLPGRRACTPVEEGTPVLNSRMTVDTSASASWPQKLRGRDGEGELLVR